MSDDAVMSDQSFNQINQKLLCCHVRHLHKSMSRQMGRAVGGGARKWYISVDPGSMAECGVNLVSGLLAEMSD